MSSNDQTWPDILWRERKHSQDPAYNEALSLFFAKASVSWTARWRGRALATAVEEALQQAVAQTPEARPVWAEPHRRLAALQHNPPSSQEMIAQLSSSDWTRRFVARHTLVTLGGEAVPFLQPVVSERAGPLKPTALWLLRSIEAETTARIFPRIKRTLCYYCQVSCRAYWTDIPGQLSMVYYGCRQCRQSRKIWTGPVVAVLDQNLQTEVEIADQYRVNWLSRRTLFDFDRVEIVQATDEEVERFAVQIGNDTYEPRRRRYARMTCLIKAGCQLSENSVRVLNQVFGRVERQ